MFATGSSARSRPRPRWRRRPFAPTCGLAFPLRHGPVLVGEQICPIPHHRRHSNPAAVAWSRRNPFGESGGVGGTTSYPFPLPGSSRAEACRRVADHEQAQSAGNRVGIQERPWSAELRTQCRFAGRPSHTGRRPLLTRGLLTSYRFADAGLATGRPPSAESSRWACSPPWFAPVGSQKPRPLLPA